MARQKVEGGVIANLERKGGGGSPLDGQRVAAILLSDAQRVAAPVLLVPHFHPLAFSDLHISGFT